LSVVLVSATFIESTALVVSNANAEVPDVNANAPPIIRLIICSFKSPKIKISLALYKACSVVIS
jgi:hypothetical protein